jgi:predicted glycosyltransferase
MNSLKKILFVLDIYFQFIRCFKIPSKKFKHIVILNHFFDQDIIALKKANIYFRITTISAFSLNRIFRCFVKLENDEWYSINDEKNQKSRNEYSLFFRKWILPIFTLLKINAFIMPSDLYPYLRDIIPILRENKIISIVIDKEGTISPYDFENFSDSIKIYNPFISDFILVWNERQKIFWKKCGINDESIVHVIGQPRSDFWFSKHKPSKDLLKYMPNDKINVLFFSFDKSAYIPEHLYRSGQITWDLLYKEVHSSIIRIAQKYPNLNFVIKTHPQQNTVDEEFLNIIKHLKNISIIGGAKLSNELIKYSQIVIGFQTTALIEAMVCGKPVIYTFWGDAPKISECLIPFHKTNALWTATSKEQLENYFEKCLVNSNITQNQQNARKDLVEKYFHNCNGQTSWRSLQIIYEKIQ